MASKSPVSAYFMLFLLALASESIFLLPFVITRVFRPTFLAVFNISNFELGSAFSAYGVVAMIAYFFGGPLADRFSPKLLLAGSLALTGLSGFYLATIPSLHMLVGLYVLWGISTILLFWSASMKAVRAVMAYSLGRAYGGVDAARGLLAALTASASVWLLALFLPDAVETASDYEQRAALSGVINAFSVLILLVAILIWFFLRIDSKGDEESSHPIKWAAVQLLAKNKLLWLQAVIVLCAYVGYKSTDDFSLLAYDLFGMDEVSASYLATVSFWMRPISALSAGLIADRLGYARTASTSFIIILSGCVLIGSGMLADVSWLIGAMHIAFVSLGIYAVRGVYFALFKEAAIPLHLTGTAIGVVSVIGYTPDVFFGPIMGYLLDTYPGETGHQYVFIFVGAFAVTGLLASLLFEKLRKRIPISTVKL